MSSGVRPSCMSLLVAALWLAPTGDAQAAFLPPEFEAPVGASAPAERPQDAPQPSFDEFAANLAAMDRRLEGGTVINIGTGQRVSVNQLFRSIAQLAGVSGDARREPPRAGDVPHSQASIARARELLEFEPQVSLEDGLAETVAWYRSRVER